MEGTHWTMSLEYLGDKKWFTTFRCLEKPEMVNSQTMTEGEWRPFDKSALGKITR